jgi:hypothetical protein
LRKSTTCGERRNKKRKCKAFHEHFLPCAVIVAARC